MKSCTTTSVPRDGRGRAGARVGAIDAVDHEAVLRTGGAVDHQAAAAAFVVGAGNLGEDAEQTAAFRDQVDHAATSTLAVTAFALTSMIGDSAVTVTDSVRPASFIVRSIGELLAERHDGVGNLGAATKPWRVAVTW